MKISVINLLLHLKNAYLGKKLKINVRYNNKLISFCKLFYNEGLIQSFKICKTENLIIIFLCLSRFPLPFKNLKLISTGSHSQNLTYLDIVKLPKLQKKFFFYTSMGILNLSQCKSFGVGGKLLFIC
jgi:ribosomal protein S8